MYAICSHCKVTRCLDRTEGNWFSCAVCGDSRLFSDEMVKKLMDESDDIDNMPQTD